MEVEKQTTTRDPLTGSTETTHVTQHVPSTASVNAHQADKGGAIIWYIAGVINSLLFLRLLFLLLGARDTGFASLLYDVTRPFVSPFQGIFAARTVETGYFDTAALLAIVIYSLVAWGIVSLIDIAKKGKV